MEYGVKTISAWVSFAILSVICVGMDYFTTIEWYKMMAVISLWYSCNANVNISFLQEGMKNFANDLVMYLSRNVETNENETSD